MKRIFGGTIRKLVALTVALAMAPVSYTHLDVYKRQHIASPPSKRQTAFW